MDLLNHNIIWDSSIWSVEIVFLFLDSVLGLSW